MRDVEVFMGGEGRIEAVVLRGIALVILSQERENDDVQEYILCVDSENDVRGQCLKRVM